MENHNRIMFQRGVKHTQTHGYSFLFHGGIILTLMLLALCGCKKEAPKEAQTADTKKESQTADINAVKDNAPADDKKADALAQANDTAGKGDSDKPDAAAVKKCEKWGSNPLFVDGQVFNYDVKIERSACCELDKDNPEWKCDDTGMCELKKSVLMQCKTTLIHAESQFCGSSIICHDNDNIAFPTGLWFVDNNGLYHFDPETKLTLNKQETPGNCKNTAYIQCNPETLAYDYAEFAEEEPLIPFVKTDIQKDECDEEGIVCESFHLKHEGKVWNREISAEGGDSAFNAVTLDETRGITAFKNAFSGGMTWTIEGNLK